jgi:iodotyrosine deiodinase
MSEEKQSMLPLDFERLDESEMQARARAMLRRFQSRRTVRHFSKDPLPLDVVRAAIRAAGTAPSGAHKQPWHFCLITDPKLKAKIREAAEKEEFENYHGRMNEEWLEDLKPFGTDHLKPHLEDAPALIAVFRQSWSVQPHASNGRAQHYYVQESVGIACGMLLAALHECGIASLTHTPSPMRFLEHILDRPSNEKAFLLIPIGYPKSGCQVPDIQRKRIEEIATEFHFEGTENNL